MALNGLDLFSLPKQLKIKNENPISTDVWKKTDENIWTWKTLHWRKSHNVLTDCPAYIIEGKLNQFENGQIEV